MNDARITELRIENEEPTIPNIVGIVEAHTELRCPSIPIVHHWKVQSRSSSPKHDLALFGSLAAVCFTYSLLSTLIVERFVDERIAILGSFVGIQKSLNTGIAFGIDLPFQSTLILIALVAMTVAGFKMAHSRLSQVAFGLIVGGGWANVVDRVMDGTVTDVFQVGSFPVFNTADSCITVGVGLLLLEIMLSRSSKFRNQVP